MICPNCKKYYGDDNVYCVDCGTRLVSDRSNNAKNPMERFSTRVKTSKPKENPMPQPKAPVREMNMSDTKLDTLILQNKELIKQNYRIIELLEKLTQ